MVLSGKIHLSFALLALACLFSVSARGGENPASNLSMCIEGEIRQDEKDLDASVYFPQKDNNDQLCALIKVAPTNSLKNKLILEVGGLGVTHREERPDGEIWFWVPYKVKNLNFSCQGYDRISNVPVNLKGGKVYNVKLRVDAAVGYVYNAKSSYSFLKFRLPEAFRDAGAMLSYGKTEECEMGAMIPFEEDGTCAVKLSYGKYYYRVGSRIYVPVMGSVVLSEPNPDWIDIDFKPRYNNLVISTDPDGALVYVNGEMMGRTPLRVREKMPAGEYRIRIVKQDYYPYDSSITLSGDGTDYVHQASLAPQFGTLNVKCPDPMAKIFVDNEFKAYGTWEGNLSSVAPHQVDARRDGHQSQSISVEIRDGEETSTDIPAPVPLYGHIVVDTTPSSCDVYLDGENKGRSPFVIENVLEGNHNLTLKKEGYLEESRNVTVEHNKSLELDIKMREIPSGYGNRAVSAGSMGVGVGVASRDAQRRTPDVPAKTDKPFFPHQINLYAALVPVFYKGGSIQDWSGIRLDFALSGCIALNHSRVFLGTGFGIGLFTSTIKSVNCEYSGYNFFLPLSLGVKLGRSDKVAMPFVGVVPNVTSSTILDKSSSSSEKQKMPINGNIDWEVGMNFNFSLFYMGISYQQGFLPVIKETKTYARQVRILLGINLPI